MIRRVNIVFAEEKKYSGNSVIPADFRPVVSVLLGSCGYVFDTGVFSRTEKA